MKGSREMQEVPSAMPEDVSGGRETRLLGLTLREIRGLPALRSLPAYRAGQIASWIFARGAEAFDDMTDLPADLREKLAGTLDISRDPVVQKTVDPAGEATKFLIRLKDGGLIESVLIQGRRRMTFCISSQVGCAYGCTFCATARMGAGRNLVAAEIVSQVLTLRADLRGRGWSEGYNIVFMGMGEPLANLPHVTQSLRVLQDPEGMAVGRRRITVSTVGLPHRIRELAKVDAAPRLAFSLVATTHEKRLAIMPIEKKYPFPTVLDALADYGARTGQRVTLEYVLLDGVNDTEDDARRLARFARQGGAKINIIAFNSHPGSAFRPSPPERMAAFLETLYPLAAAVTVRHSRGRKIQAACGQLATESRKPAARRPSDTSP